MICNLKLTDQLQVQDQTVFIMKDIKELVIIEGSIPGNINLSSRAESRAGKYMGLATAIKNAMVSKASNCITL